MTEAIEKLVSGRNLDRDESRRAAVEILSGDVPDSVIGGLLVALKARGESAGEIAGFVEGMREVEVSITPRVDRLVDTCGTGGDGKGTFNISTTAAFITAACGVPVAKHGNRGVSSRCGSADVLEALGVRVEMEPEQVRACIEKVGIGFMFAPVFHPAMRRVAGPRKALGIPTIFNVLGPLVNPAGATSQVVGVNRPELVRTVGSTLSQLGRRSAFVLHGLDGMDEFTLVEETSVCEVRSGSLLEYVLAPEDLGFERCTEGELEGGDARRNAEITLEVLEGRAGPRRDVAVANASFAVLASGAAGSLAEAVEMAGRAVETGEAARVLERLIDYCSSDLPSAVDNVEATDVH